MKRSKRKPNIKRKIGKGRSFVIESVIILGLLSGIWIHIGINPQKELYSFAHNMVNQISPGNQLNIFFWAFPTIMTMASVVGTFMLGGWLGLISTFLAFIAGIIIDTTTGLTLLAIALILGFIAPLTKKRK